jgi:biotin carboxylase
MRISQPSSGPDAGVAGKRLLVLGAGLWQVEYLRCARELGVETWATDWSPDAPGREEAHHFEPIDLKDRDATLALARRARIDGILTAADIGVPTAAFIAEELGLPGPGLRLALDATDKGRMRERAAAAGVNCPWFYRVRSPADAARRAARLPVIVKPTDNCSSRGVRVVSHATALDEAVRHAIDHSRGGEALVEEFLSGTEGSIEAFVQRGEVTVLGFCDKTKSPLPDRYDLELRYPGAYAPDVTLGIHNLVLALVRAFDVTDAILHVEFLVVPDGRVFLVEFAIRGCGSKVITHLLPRLTGANVVRAVVRQALGLTTRLDLPRQRHGALHFLMFPPGRVRHVRGLDDAQAIPGVIDVCVERAPGDTIDVIRDGRSRPGHVLVEGKSREAVQAVLRAVHAAIRVEYDGGRESAPLRWDTWTYA